MPTQRKTRSRADRARPIHAETARELALMWARYWETGQPGNPADYPRAMALYSAALRAWRSEPVPSLRRGFVYEGQRYGWEITNLDRLRIIDFKTKELLFVGAIGDVA